MQDISTRQQTVAWFVDQVQRLPAPRTTGRLSEVEVFAGSAAAGAAMEFGGGEFGKHGGAHARHGRTAVGAVFVRHGMVETEHGGSLSKQCSGHDRGGRRPTVKQ